MFLINKKLLFCFYPTDLELKQLSPSGSANSARYIPQLDALRLGIYPPLFAPPSGDSCIKLLVSMILILSTSDLSGGYLHLNFEQLGPS